MNGSGPETCLVVGAGGFLGTHVCAALREHCTLWRATSSAAAAQGEGWLHLDVTRPDTLRHLPLAVNSVVYLAQSPHYRDFPHNAEHIWGVNVQGLLLMLEYARKAGAHRFVLASSGSVYARSDGDLSEDSPLDDSPACSFYVRSKRAAELLLHAYSPYFSTLCLRFFTLYGEGLGQGMLLARMINAVAQGLPITLADTDGLVFNPLHVSDAASATAAALRLEGSHTINVAGGQTLTLGAACRIMGQALHNAPQFTLQGEPWRLVANISRMRALLGTPRVTLEAGLAEYARKTGRQTQESAYGARP